MYVVDTLVEDTCDSSPTELKLMKLPGHSRLSFKIYLIVIKSTNSIVASMITGKSENVSVY